MLMMTPLYSVEKKPMWPKNKIQKASVKLFKWFHENDLKTNQDKCHFISSLDINAKFSLPACILENSDSEKLFGVTVNRKLNFKEHVTNLWDKASKKIQAHVKIFPYIPQTQKQLLMNAFILPRLGYCNLVWMSHTFCRTKNNCINELHKGTVILVYSDFSSRFSELLE